MQQIEIKRKFFDIIEQIGPRSFKVQRKNDLYFLKNFENDKKGFEDYVDRLNTFKMCGVKIPKVYCYDKNTRLVVCDWVDGETMDSYLAREDLDEEMIRKVFECYWFAKQDRLCLDFKPENFKYSDGKLYYLAYKYTKLEDNKKFITKDIRYWFPTEELQRYINSRGLDFDPKRVKSEYETNKIITLMTIKYYK